jgi:hypothetical protein
MQLEYQLRTEIEFWQDIIETRPEDACEDTLERVMRARSLAEQKLEALLEKTGVLLN